MDQPVGRPFGRRVAPDRATCTACHGLRPGRRPGNAPAGAYRNPCKAGRLFRRQKPDHRLRSLQCAEFRHSAHQRCDAIQGPQPDPPSCSAAGTSSAPSATRASTYSPQARASTTARWYAGTADAVHQNADIIESYGPRYIVLLAGDHIYKMDYETMLQQHVEQDADVTVGVHRGSAHGRDRFRRHGGRRPGPHHLLSRETCRPARTTRRSRQSPRKHGDLRLRDPLPDADPASGCRKP